MLGPMLLALACSALVAVAAQQAPAGDPAAPRPADAQPAPRPGRAEDRASKEAKLLADLAPAPLQEERIRAIAASFGADAGTASALDIAIAQYAAQTAEAHRRVLASTRARLASGYRATAAGGQLEAQPGPELAALIADCAAWRRTLAAADTALLRQLAVLRTADSARCPGQVAWDRTVERDDLPATDPGAALRVPELLDAAQLAASERTRVELALDRQWAAVAAAIAARRLAVADADAERARLLEQWGAAWQLAAPAQVVDERLRVLERLEARARAAEGPLRDANRAAALALLRLLPPDAADRVRDLTDRTLWPWLFDAELAVAETVRKAGELGGPALADPLNAMLRDLSMRLSGSRRELAKRAAAAEEVEAIVAAAESGAPTAELVPMLEARLRLHDLLARRLRTVTDMAAVMQQAASGDPRTKALLDERLESLRALARTHQWEQRGLVARITELGAPAPADEAAGDSMAPREPAPPR